MGEVSPSGTLIKDEKLPQSKVVSKLRKPPYLFHHAEKIYELKHFVLSIPKKSLINL